MTQSAVAISWDESGQEAGKKIADSINLQMNGKVPHAVIVFASSKYVYSEILEAIDEGVKPELMVGCSSAGEFTDTNQKEGAACAIALWSDRLKFSAGLGQNVQSEKTKAAESIVSRFKGLSSNEYQYHTAIVMTDALAGYTDDFVKELTLKTQGKYQLVGGGAGDDAKFSQTQVFFGTAAYENAAVALEILSNEPIGIGVKHGWETASAAYRVTEVDGSRLVSINARPAVEVFQEFARETRQSFNVSEPIPFFLHNVIGIHTNSGYKLRVPLSVNADGSISCASDIPENSTIHIMRTTNACAIEAAATAAETALAQMKGAKPSVAIFFDCVATRLRVGLDFGLELNALSGALDGAKFVGCNTYGQIARVDGQFSGFHNCTAVTCILP